MFVAQESQELQVTQDGDPVRSTVFQHFGLEEMYVKRAQEIRFAFNCSVYDMIVVRVGSDDTGRRSGKDRLSDIIVS